MWVQASYIHNRHQTLRITWYRRATGEGQIRGDICPPENFKILRSNFEICRNFRGINMEFYSIIIFKKSHLNFSLSYWLIIFLQDLSWDTPSDRQLRKWLAFNHNYAGTVKTWEIVWNVGISETFCSFTTFFWDRHQFGLMELLTLGFFWTVQTAETFKVIREILTCWLL